MKVILRVDENGFLMPGEERFIHHEDDIPDGFVVVTLPTDENGQQLPFYKPKWTGSEWIEGATQEEINEATKPKPRPLTDTEILGQQMTERELEAILQGQQITDVEIRVMMLEMGANPL